MFFAGASAGKKPSTCEESGKAYKCTCGADDTNTGALAITLSKTRNELQMLCRKNLQGAPASLSQSKVRSTDPAKLTSCLKTSDSESVNFTTLLYGNPQNVKWAPAEASDEEVLKTLNVPEANLPFVDQNFVINEHDWADSHMRLRSSQQPPHQQITITPSHNAFTLTCGDQGEVLPTLHTQTYCIIGEKTDAEAKCSGSYADVLPGYEETWWKAGNSKNSFTLTIPTDKFPKESATIMVGCGKATTSTAERIEPESALSPSVCSVDVTIEGTGSSILSSALPRNLTTVLSAVGASGLTALLVRAI
ncbi:SAG-related sequence [Besnoitia besnoiti]|uniref:SAG-related sequence n=1 Tax=Besnoitia besnoiti TaxID=94643 RepID=A0A2A9MA41_BESBE|nr:SAG-related sequence [Besnoitia besnoiti]PFH32477.1 SAG-related sequence [Besnoitia besnoiti]